MNSSGWAQLVFVVVALAVVVPLLGRYLAAVFGPYRAPGDQFFDPLERRLFRLIGVDPSQSQRWSHYALSVLAFSAVSVVGLFALLRFQAVLPFNPTDARRSRRVWPSTPP